MFLQSDLLPRKRNIFPRRYSQQVQENKECHNLLTLDSDTFILVTACCIQENGLKRESPCLIRENISFRAQCEAAGSRRTQSTFCPWCPILYRKIQAQPVKNSMMGPMRKSSPQKGGRSTSTTRNRFLQYLPFPQVSVCRDHTGASSRSQAYYRKSELFY